MYSIVKYFKVYRITKYYRGKDFHLNYLYLKNIFKKKMEFSYSLKNNR